MKGQMVHVSQDMGVDSVLKSTADRMLKINPLNSMTVDLADRFMEGFKWHMFLSSLVEEIINILYKRGNLAVSQLSESGQLDSGWRVSQFSWSETVDELVQAFSSTSLEGEALVRREKQSQ